ncbi:MAG: hypothetical protein ACJ72H_29585 [Candidatus Sulfotelmatobacter sp.]
MVEGEVVFAWTPYADQDDSRGRNGCLMNGALYGWLYYLMRGMAYCAIRMRQSIRMVMGLLNRVAEDEQEGADDGKQNVSAHFGRSILPYTPHFYQHYTSNV